MFTVGILTDNWGDETAWWLKERNINGSFDTMISRDMQLPNNIYSEKQVCINNSKCYKFNIMDEGKNGICCGENGDGWYQIKVDGKFFVYLFATYNMKLFILLCHPNYGASYNLTKCMHNVLHSYR